MGSLIQLLVVFVEVDPREDYSIKATTDEIIAKVHNMILDDRDSKINEIDKPVNTYEIRLHTTQTTHITHTYRTRYRHILYMHTLTHTQHTDISYTHTYIYNIYSTKTL